MHRLYIRDECIHCDITYWFAQASVLKLQHAEQVQCTDTCSVTSKLLGCYFSPTNLTETRLFVRCNLKVLENQQHRHGPELQFRD